MPVLFCPWTFRSPRTDGALRPGAFSSLWIVLATRTDCGLLVFFVDIEVLLQINLPLRSLVVYPLLFFSFSGLFGLLLRLLLFSLLNLRLQSLDRCREIGIPQIHVIFPEI